MRRSTPLAQIPNRIRAIRGQRVLLSKDLADLYQVEHRTLTQAVKRNVERFPDDFMFRLTVREWRFLRSQIVILKNGGRGHHLKYPPYAFTEQGVAMLSSVLKSERAIRINIEIMRTFVRLRDILARNRDLARKLAALEKRYDHQFSAVFESIRELLAPPAPPPRRAIGFRQLEALATGGAATGASRSLRK